MLKQCRHPLSLILLIGLMAAVFLSAPTWAAEKDAKPLTREQIGRVLAAQDSALERGDAAGFAAHWAPEYKLIARPGPNGEPARTMARADYEAVLQKDLPALRDYRVRHIGRKIEISPDGKTASVTQTNFETVTVSGRRMASAAASTLQVELRGGKPVIVSEENQVLQREEGDSKTGDSPLRSIMNRLAEKNDGGHAPPSMALMISTFRDHAASRSGVVRVESVQILRLGLFNEDGKYWPIEARARGRRYRYSEAFRAHNRDGNATDNFETVGRYMLRRDDFGDWKLREMLLE